VKASKAFFICKRPVRNFGRVARLERPLGLVHPAPGGVLPHTAIGGQPAFMMTHSGIFGLFEGVRSVKRVSGLSGRVVEFKSVSATSGRVRTYAGENMRFRP